MIPDIGSLPFNKPGETNSQYIGDLEDPFTTTAPSIMFGSKHYFEDNSIGKKFTKNEKPAQNSFDIQMLEQEKLSLVRYFNERQQ